MAVRGCRRCGLRWKGWLCAERGEGRSLGQHLLHEVLATADIDLGCIGTGFGEGLGGLELLLLGGLLGTLLADEGNGGWGADHSRIVVEEIGIDIEGHVEVDVVDEGGVKTAELASDLENALNGASLGRALGERKHGGIFDVDEATRGFGGRRWEDVGAGHDTPNAIDDGREDFGLETLDDWSEHHERLTLSHVPFNRGDIRSCLKLTGHLK